ncbi:MAG: family 43 glycosylhydrolase [Clostridia bacterium]|nr:family 43 glycosylhydrolase [Clostridia bacterium]
MKKTLALLLTGVLLLPSLFACQSNKPDTTTVPTGENGPVFGSNDLDLSPVEEVSYFRNPLLSSKKVGFGLGDPFAMRYNGKYYLYVTGTGIPCWSSDDMVNWKYEGVVSKDPRTKDAYAPEVYYYNGYFYMYTSPGGNGHYVLRSESPTGPFEMITDNVQMSIDGSVFIDNNGKWYFYTAGGNAIESYQMSSPSSFSHTGTLNVTSMNGWTEGPMVIYHDGYYYMTYTGNHFLSRTYRINYVSSSRAPTSLSEAENNPVLVCTDDAVHNIGHSSTVKGPDLDSYYIVYHSMADNGTNRDVNIDRIIFNGERMEVMGPNTSKQQVPDMPDIYAHFRSGESLEGWSLNGSMASSGGFGLTPGSTLISNNKFDGNYTAEYNVTNIKSGGKAGAIFSYTDDKNFGTCVFDPATQKVIVTITVNGESAAKEFKMVQSFKEDVKFDCLQSLQIEKKGNTYTFYMNDRELGEIESALPSGSIGYIADGADANFGFIGGTGAVGGQGNANQYKTISKFNGLISADSYTIGTFETVTKSKINAVVAKQGNVLNYRVYAAQNGTYDLAMEYFTGSGAPDATIEVYVDGQKVRDVALTGSEKYATVISRDIPIDKGEHTVAFKIVSGTVNISKFILQQSEEVPSTTWDYSKSTDNNTYTDGSFTIRNGALTMGNTGFTGKRLYGDKNWGDYTVEVEVTPNTKVGCGLMVRATNPGALNYVGNAPTDTEAHLGTDWVQGYYVGLTSTSVVLGKQNYGYKALKSGKLTVKEGTTYTLKVVCEGANLKIYVDGQLYIDYTDASPFIQGMIGVRTNQCGATFDNLKVYK